MSPLHRLIALADCAPGTVRRVVLQGEELAVSRTDEGLVHVTTDICPHGHCSIGKGGTVRAGTLVCPCHGSAFDLATGEVLSPPARFALRRYPHTEQDGAVWVEL